VAIASRALASASDVSMPLLCRKMLNNMQPMGGSLSEPTAQYTYRRERNHLEAWWHCNAMHVNSCVNGLCADSDSLYVGATVLCSVV